MLRLAKPAFLPRSAEMTEARAEARTEARAEPRQDPQEPIMRTSILADTI